MAPDRPAKQHRSPLPVLTTLMVAACRFSIGAMFGSAGSILGELDLQIRSC